MSAACCLLCSTDSQHCHSHSNTQSSAMKSSQLLSPIQPRPSTASPFHYHMQSPASQSSSQLWTLEDVQRAEAEEDERDRTTTKKRWAHTSPQRLIEKQDEEQKEAVYGTSGSRDRHTAHNQDEQSKLTESERRERRERKAEREKAVKEDERDEERRRKRKEERRREKDPANSTQRGRVDERRRADSREESNEFSVEFSRDDETNHTDSQRLATRPQHKHSTTTQPAQSPQRSTERRKRREADRLDESSSSAVSRDERAEKEKRRERKANEAREAEKKLAREQRKHKEKEKDRDSERPPGHSQHRGRHAEKEKEAKEEQSWEEALEEEQRKEKESRHESALHQSSHPHDSSSLPRPHSHHHSDDDGSRHQHSHHTSNTGRQHHAATDKPQHNHHLPHHQRLPSGTEPIHSHVHTEHLLSSTNAPPLAELLNVPILRCPLCSHHYHSPHSHHHHTSDATTTSHPLSSTASLFSRLPRLLSCAHTFCTGCLTAAQAEVDAKGDEGVGRWVACPFGCAATVVKGCKGVLGVEVNEAVVALLEEVKTGETHHHHHHVERHTSEPAAHSHHHHHFHHHQHHSHHSKLSASLSLLSHMSSAASSIFCSVHPTHPLTLYCHDCSMLICLACISPLFSPPHASATASTSIASLLSSGTVTSATLHSLPLSHHQHRTSKKDELLQHWRESSLLPSLHSRVAAERTAIEDTLAQLSKSLNSQRQLQRDEERRVRERMGELRQRLLAMVAEKEEEMVRRLADRRNRAEEKLEDERRVLSVECNDLALLLTKAQYKSQLDEGRERRERHDGVEERVPGLTREQMAREEEDVREMRWISDLIRTLAIERTVRSQAADEPAQSEEDSRVQLRLAVGEVAEATRRELAVQCVLVDSVPVSHCFVGVKVDRRDGTGCVGGECVLRWEASAAEAVVEWQVEWLEKRKPVVAHTQHTNHSSHQAANPSDSGDERDEKDEWQQVDDHTHGRLGLASLTQSLLSVSLALPPASTGVWTRLYTGSASTCTQSIAHDSVYVYRLRGVNSVGCSEWLESEVVQLPSELLAFRFAGDTNGVAYHKGGSDTAGGLRVTASSLHPSSAPLSTLCCRRPTTVATLPLPHSYVQVDTCKSDDVAGLVLTHYTLLDPQHREWQHRHLTHWRLLASSDDRHYTAIHEQRRGQHQHHQQLASSGRRGRQGAESEQWNGCEVCVVDVERSRNGGRGYRYFRVEQVGVNGDNDYSLVLGGLELYGLLAV